MREEDRGGSEERAVLTALITSKEVLSRVAPACDGPMFGSRAADLVLSWCLDYYASYREAPKGAIESLYASWASKRRDASLVGLVESLLRGLSGDYERLGAEANVGFLVDSAARVFDRARAVRLKDDLEAALAAGDLGRVDELIAGHRKVELGAQSGADVLSDPLQIQDAFAGDDEPLFRYGSGDLAKFTGSAFSRDCFVSFLAPEGVGKSWFLLDVAYQAVTQRVKVAFFESGDMSKAQVLRRLYSRAAGRPWKARTVRIPTDLRVVDQTAKVDHEEKTYPERITEAEVESALERLGRHKVKSKQSYLKLSCHGTGTLTVKKIRATLEEYDRQGFNSSICLIDYADLLAPRRRYESNYDAIKSVWDDLRALSLDRHCCVVTATQARRDGYQARLLTKDHVSDCKAKTADVSSLIGINQIDAEKAIGVYRLNHCKVRSEDFLASRPVFVAGCLSLASPCMRSKYG